MAEDKNLFAGRDISDLGGMRFAVVTARFNGDITDRLNEGALAGFKECGVDVDRIDLFSVAGCFELPLVAKRLAETGKYAAIVALGAVIRGETPHFEYVSAETARGIGQVSLDTGVPVAFGVLTTDSHEQARARAGGESGNKGRDAALTAAETASVLRSIGA